MPETPIPETPIPETAKTGPGCPFIWYELMTSDCDGAEAFYRTAMGWGAADSGLPDHRYTIFSADPSNPATGVAGLMAIPEAARAAGARPGWTGYVLVDDVDACAARAEAAGGRILVPAAEIATVGRFAVLADPHGAVFALFRPLSEKVCPPVPPGTPGHIGWHELHAGDGGQAFAFYARLFGWTRAEAIPMGDHGVYQLFATGGEPVGGMMTRMPQTPMPFWLFYVNVDGLDGALARVTGAGGRIVNGPMEVPGGKWIAQALDPQGAMFAVVSARR
jgi:predicted enzyme related to lactoylglutathione lyase